MAIAALLEPQVVVGADTREGRDFLAAQSWRTPHTGDPNSGIRGIDQLASGAQVRAESVERGHLSTVAVAGRPILVLSGPRMNTHCLTS